MIKIDYNMLANESMCEAFIVLKKIQKMFMHIPKFYSITVPRLIFPIILDLWEQCATKANHKNE